MTHNIFKFTIWLIFIVIVKVNWMLLSAKQSYFWIFQCVSFRLHIKTLILQSFKNCTYEKCLCRLSLQVIYFMNTITVKNKLFESMSYKTQKILWYSYEAYGILVRTKYYSLLVIKIWCLSGMWRQQTWILSYPNFSFWKY